VNGPPQKPISALSSGAPRARADGLEHERHRLLRLGDAEPPHVLERLDRPLDHRPTPSTSHVDAHAEDREHDVREHHRRVHAVQPTGSSVPRRTSSGCRQTSNSE
jgi:hypothetical protein